MSFVVTYPGVRGVAPLALPGDVLTIGRDPASDIVLPDLAVRLEHARLRRLDGRLWWEPIGGRRRRVAREVRLGAYRLAVTPGDPDAIAVTRVDAPAPDRRGFALGSVAPGKRPLAWALALAIVAAFLAWPIWSLRAHAPTPATASWSPGKLSLAHAGLEGKCAACHARSFKAVEDTSCRACHAGVHDHADRTRLLAARAPASGEKRLREAVAIRFGATPGRCAECHTEHEGAVAMAPTPQRFCAECHADLHARLPDTRIGDAGDFTLAHPQFRPAVLLRPGPDPLIRRVSLDAHPRQATGLIFPHALHLDATGSVARMAQTLGKGSALGCASCHTGDGAGFKQVTMEGACQGCHSLAFGRTGGVMRTLRHGDSAQAIAELTDYYAAHRPAPAPVRRRPGDFAAPELAPAGNARAAALHAVFGTGGLCADCHQVGPGPTIAPVTVLDRFLPDAAFDHRAHAATPCAGCHAAAASGSSADLLMPGIATCRGCHASPASAAHGQVPSSCALCHVFHRGDATPARQIALLTRREAAP